MVGLTFLNLLHGYRYCDLVCFVEYFQGKCLLNSKSLIITTSEKGVYVVCYEQRATRNQPRYDIAIDYEII